ncbi:AsnC family transcriptional regulator [Aurantibacter sp.]|uniref:Lrp/AsnC family transcriptional regulator n=1 Tax=Aurantibacter sp. TaxID=2807103 RepID=UPI00326781F9
MKNKIDEIDNKILGLLSDNAQMPYTEIAKKLVISPGTVHARINKMKTLGVIKGATLSLDYSKIGWKMTIFLGIYLRETMLYKQVIKQLKEVNEVVKIHHSTGKYDVFIKMHAKDSIHYRKVYQDSILTINGIKGIESFMSIEESMSRHISFE